MRRSKAILRGLTGLLLLAMLGVGMLGGAGLSVRAAPVQQVALSVVINEVAWAGTQQSSDDDWIELYNPSLTDQVNISDWEIISSNFSITIPPATFIPADSYYLIERRDAATTVPANLTASNLILGNNGNYLRLRSSNGTLIDSANDFNSNSGSWPAGNQTTHATMERGAIVVDSNLAWITYDQGVDPNAGSEFDSNGNAILGTPGRGNWPANMTATPTFTPSFTATSTSSPTPTDTFTPTPITPTSTKSPTVTPLGSLSIVINEVAWAGTTESPDDDWVELYNPTTVDIDISGWKLVGNGFTIDFPEDTVIPTNNRYFLIERRENATSVDSDFIYEDLMFGLTNERLYLYNDKNDLIDSANSNSGQWPAGNLNTHSSMQRSVLNTDSNFVWVTYYASADSSSNFAKDARGNNILGTPRRGNVPINVTTTPTPTVRATARPGFTAVGGVVLPPIIGISEFLPRPGYDWNNDGEVDVFDEFIEIINAGQIDINLSAYRLDDEANSGSLPFVLPNVVLKPNERAVFYASETGILLSDAGDTVRLLRGSTVVDAYTYNVVRYPDQAWCRIPDRLGYWNDPCFPTPNNPNALTGTLPLPSKPVGYSPPVCLLPDTTPDEFVYAECEVGGDGIWNRQFWDEADEAERRKLDEEQKWETIFE